MLVFVIQDFSLDPQNEEDPMEKVKEMLRADASLVVGTSTSLASPGGAPPQAEKIKLAQEHFGLAHKVLMVSSRWLEYLYLLME